MKWEVKRLGEIITLEYGKPLPDSKRCVDGAHPAYGANGAIARTDEFYWNKRTIVVGRKGSVGELTLTEEKFWPLDVTYFVKFDESRVTLGFLYHLLSLLNLPSLAKGVKPGLNRNEVYDIEVPVPPVSEQRRIVAILDEAFAGIAKAKEAAEKNRLAAREIFEAELEKVFREGGKGWEEKRLGEVAKHSLGKMLDKAKNQGQPQKYLRNINVRWFEIDKSDLLEMRFREEEFDKYTVRQGDVLICEGGYPGRAAIWKEDEPIFFQKAIHRVRFHKPQYNKLFVYYLYLSSINGNLKSYCSGTGIQHFTGEALNGFIFPMPPAEEVASVCVHLDILSLQTQKLEALYTRKLTALDELQRSLLQKAFAGELTGRKKRTIIIRLPVRVPDISSTDLHAGIIAMALDKHIAAKCVDTFHHVKSEKIVHLAEGILEIELDRTPRKAAAGPNDFPRLKVVESRAAKAGFFYVRKEGGIYVYTRGNQSRKLIERLQARLGEKYDQLSELIELLVPLNTEQAEVVATVYAAWNNLLIDGADITDEAIVYEARENWHEKKMGIERERFFKAIQWMKAKGLVPKGVSKKVDAKNS